MLQLRTHRRTLMFGLLLLFTASAAFAQEKYYNHWYFGFLAGVDFSKMPPRSDGALKSTEGCAAISNPVTGELLFYTNGVDVWNRNHAVMLNGTGLNGHASSTQSCLIVPKPGDPNIFYVFTTYAGAYAGIPEGGLEYSTVDMRGDGGLGEVVDKNAVLLGPGLSTEKLVGIRHCNSDDFWVVGHGTGSNRFYSWLVTKDGVTMSPVTSDVGDVHQASDAFAIGYLKASPNGKYLFSVVQQTRSGELFPFDNATGIVGERMSRISAYYGVSFSPDSKLLYVTMDVPKPEIHQYTIVLNGKELDGSSIPMTFRRIYSMPFTSRMPLRAMQLGPDKKLYVVNEAHLGVIDAPNTTATYRDSAIVFDDPRYPTAVVATNGLPNCIDGFLSSEPLPASCLVPDSITARFSLSDTVICQGDSIDYTDLSFENPARWEWRFEGGRPGQSASQHPKGIRYDEPGTYFTRLIVTRDAATDTTYSTVIVTPAPDADAGPDRVICLGDSTMLEGSGRGTYEWSPSRFLSCDDCPSPVASPSETTTYTLTVTNAAGCVDVDSVEVVVRPDIVLELTPDVDICRGVGTQLKVSGAEQYEWTPSEGLSCDDCADPVASPTTTTTYVVRGVGSGGGSCMGGDSVTVRVVDPPTAEAGPDVTLCPGEQVRLNASGGTKYRWDDSEDLSCLDCADPLVMVTGSVTYYVTVSNDAGCESRDSVTVSVHPPADVDAGPDMEICVGGEAELKASGGESYHWDDSEDLSCLECSNPTASPSATSIFRVMITDANGCSAYDSVTVTVRPGPDIDAGGTLVICAGDQVRLNASGGVSYEWEASDDLSCLSCPDPIATPTTTTTYRVTGTDEAGCSGTASVTVEVRMPEPIEMRREYAICPGDSVRIDVPSGLGWEWTPSQGLSCTSCPNPVASPAVTTLYRVAVTTDNGCSLNDSVLVRVRETPDVIATSIARTFEAIPDQRLEIPIVVSTPVVNSNIDEIEVILEYDAGVMVLDTKTLEELLGGTMLDGWSLTVEEARAGYSHLRLTAPPGRTLTGSGNLLRLPARLYLAGMPGTEIDYSISTRSSCFVFTADPGYASLNDICGLDFRLIESTSQKFVAPEAYPNPAGERVRITFGIGLEGHVLLEVFDPSGARVGSLVNRDLEEGTYSVEWDPAGHPTGVYHYRIVSGTWVKTGRLIIAR